jgi:four helix bundle protein
MGIHDEARLDTKFINFSKQMNLYLNHFPRHEKYGLCQQIRRTAYEVYGYIVESQKRYHKKTSMANLDICHEQLRMFVRLAFELGYFEFTDGSKTDEEKDRMKVAVHRYLTISLMVDELGRLIGGWLEADKAKQITPVAGSKREAP